MGDGDVGIGTSSPASRLHVAGNRAQLRLENTSGTGRAHLQFGTADSEDEFIIYNSVSATTGFKLMSDGNVSLVPDSGNVGIGTTGPSKMLEITSLGYDLDTHLGLHNRTTNADQGTGIAFSIINQTYAGYQGALMFVRNSNANGTGNFHFLSDIANDGLTLDDATLTIKNSGNVGIGTTSPSNPLVVGPDYGSTYSGNKVTIADTTGVPGVVVGESNSVRGWLLWSTTSDYLYLGTVGYAATLVMKDGNVGIGTTTPNSKLHMNGAADEVALRAQVNGQSKLIVASTGGVSIGANQTSPPANGLYVAGNVGIGTTAPSVALDVVGSIEYTGTITDVSDARLKENIVPVTGALDKVRAIDGVYFNMIDTPGRTEVGVLAQDVREVLPEAVSIIDPENGYYGVNYNGILPVMLEAIKELKTEKDAEIEFLKARNAEIMSRLEALEAR